MALSKLTKITGPGVSTDTNWVGNNANFTGITTTATSFNIGVTTIHSTLIESHNIKSTGIITATGGSFSGNVTAVDGTFTGNVSIAGTLTYEDVTNIDAVGIITAPALDVDDFLDVGSNIKLGNAGVITATSFVGALTGNVTGNVSGNATGLTGNPTINVTDLDVDGHTNLDNVSIAGVTTFAGNINCTSGRFQRGSSTVQDGDAIAGGININGTDMDASVIMSVFGNDSDFTRISGSKSRNASVGSHTIVQNNDVLLSLKGFGSDGTNFEEAAQIEMQVDGTPNNNVMPGRIVFKTATTDGVTEKLRIDSGGGVLVGTSTVTASKVTVYGANDAAAIFQGSGTGTGAANGFLVGNNGGTDGLLWNYENGATRFATNNVERFLIDTAGNVGMGTNVVSDSTGNARAFTIARSDANGQVRLILKNQATGFGNGAGFHQGIDGANAFIENRTNGGYLDFTTNNSGSTETRVRIISDGKVGISSGTPTEALEVRGNIFCRGATTSDKPRIKFGFTNGVIQGGKTEGNVGQDYLAISADGGTTDHFVVDYGGNVGISSINPQRPLDVRGEVFANRFTAYSAPTSTYNNQTTGVKYGARGAYTLTLGGNRGGNTNSFTIFEAKDFNNSKYFCLEISFHHAGGGVHGSYRRFAGICNGYTSITTLNDTGNVNVGGGLGFAISKPDNHTLRVTWNGCSGFADSYTLYCKLDVSNGNSYFSAIDSAFY